MTSAAIPLRKVLAVADASGDPAALRAAAALADRYAAQLEVFACVEPPADLGVMARLSGTGAERLLEDLTDRRRAEVEALIATHVPGRAVPLHMGRGKTFVEVIRNVIAADIDLVVKAAEPLSGVNRFLFASTDQHLLRKCPCPVWLHTPGTAAEPKRILAAVDVDAWDADEPETLRALNRRVIEAARAVAAPSGAEVVVLHAWDAVGDGMVWAFSSTGDARATAEAYVNEVIAARRAALDALLREVGDGDAPLIPRLVRGAPERVIEEEGRAMQADVVVMGTVARTGLGGVFIGNTAENIINSLGLPVLAVKPDGFVSPLARG
jgi:nucleotide-binding universal stress UspA family protein